MKNKTYFPKTLRIRNEIIDIGPQDVKDLYNSKSLKELINNTFSEEYSQYLKNGEYFDGCSFKIYQKHYQSRLKEYLLIRPDADEFDFLENEDAIISRIIDMGRQAKGHYYSFYSGLYDEPHKANFKLSAEKTRNFIDSKIHELGHFFIVPGYSIWENNTDPTFWEQPREIKIPARNPDVKKLPEINFNTTESSLPKNSKLKIYHLENEQGVYFPEDDLLYVDENSTHLVYDIVSRIVMQKKEITSQLLEKLEKLTLVKEKGFYTFLYKRFLSHKEVPSCDCFTGTNLHIDSYEENTLKLQEWVNQISFIYDALAEDPLKRVILLQKSEDLINWHKQFQTSKAYQDEFNRIIENLQSEIGKPKDEDLSVLPSPQAFSSKLSALETAYLAHYLVESKEYKFVNGTPGKEDWEYFSNITDGASSTNIRKFYSEILKKDIRLQPTRTTKIKKIITYIKTCLPDFQKSIHIAEQELQIMEEKLH